MINGPKNTDSKEQTRSTKIDCTKTVEEYINKHDWRINANSNTGYSNAGLVNNIAGKVVANYWLDEVYTKEAGDAHRNGDIHIHDLDCLSPYCFTKDTKFKTFEYGMISFEEIINRGIQTCSVYSFNPETNKVCERQAYDFRCTRKDAKIIEVEFSDGFVVRCTPDHKFLTPITEINVETDKISTKFEWAPIETLYMKNVRTTRSAPEFFNKPEIDTVCLEHNMSPEKFIDICPKVVRITPIEQPEDVYCMTVDDTHNFILENDIIAHNCCGHDLQRLLEEGFNGVPGRPASKAPKHFREALGQMANYLGILQAEWAGAQAFSSFDTFLSPYVFFDMYYGGAEFKDIKKAILQFIYNLNVPARWGQCVPIEYKCKKADGTWATVDELKIGDEICVFDIETGEIKTDIITHLNVYDRIITFHHYLSLTESGQSFSVTPNHRMIIEDNGKFIIKESADIINQARNGNRIKIPTANGIKEFVGGELKVKSPMGRKVWCPTTNTGTFVCMTDTGYVFYTGNSPFTNITVDWKVPADMKDNPPMRDGEHYFVSIFKDYAEHDKIDADKLHRMLCKLRKRLGIEIDMDRILIDADNEYLYEILYQISYSIFEDEMVIIDKAFYECLNEGDLLGQPFVFPIPTINITEDFDWDDERANVLFENAAKYGSSYFQNFIGSQYIIDENGNKVKDPKAYGPNDVRSMAFLGTQEIIYRDANGRVSKNELRHLVEIWLKATEDNKPKYEFLINGEFHPISEMFAIDYNNHDSIISIELENGYIQKFSEDHKCVVLTENKTYEEKYSQDLKPGDKFIISKKPWGITNGIGTYDAGRILGYYIAEGHFNSEEGNRVLFAINIKRNDIVDNIKNFFMPWGIEVKVDTQPDVNIHNVTVYGKAAVNFVGHFVRGNKATEKRLNTFLWNTSDDFRRGVYDGYLDTDGCVSAKNFAHTTNKELCQDFIILASSIGKILSYKVKENNSHYFKPDKSDLEYFTSYKLNIRNFEEFEDYYVVSIRNVTKINASRTKTVYNFTIMTDKHWVELPNGIVSHQCCRLKLDLAELRKKGGGLFGADSQTGSIGNITFNMARLGYLYKGDKEALYKKLDYLLDISKDCHEKKRKFVEEMNARGLYPYTRRYIRTFNTYFSTIGLNGMNEMVRNFTDDQYDITTDYGQNMCKEIMMYLRERLVQIQEETGNLYNLEASPGEGTTFRLAKSDFSKFGSREITYIECEKHGRVEIKTNDDTEYAECPICRSESEG